MSGISSLVRDIYMFIWTLITQSPLVAILIGVGVVGYYILSRALIKIIFKKTLNELIRGDDYWDNDAARLNKSTKVFFGKVFECWLLIMILFLICRGLGFHMPRLPFMR
jgi:hypothetical protein